jgi:predicted phosphodiesterase
MAHQRGTGIEAKILAQIESGVIDTAALVKATGGNPNTIRRLKSEWFRRLIIEQACTRERREPKHDVRAWHERAVALPQTQDDADAIASVIAGLRVLGRPAVLTIASDQHIPDHDPRALALNIETERHVQPDLRVDGGDIFDLPTISHFAKDKAVPIISALRMARPDYYRYIDARMDVSSAPIIHVSGNHDDRVRRKRDEWFQMGEEIQDAYAALVRAEGRVLWHGWLQDLEIGYLNIIHGERTNIHASKSTLETDLAYGMSVVFGHTHRYGLWTKMTKPPGGRRRLVQSVNIGFGGNNPPAYKSEMHRAVDWVHGSAMAHVYLDDWIVNIQPIPYHVTQAGGMVCFVGSTRLEVDREGRRVW